jgi:hypothetical protein
LQANGPKIVWYAKKNEAAFQICKALKVQKSRGGWKRECCSPEVGSDKKE